MFNILFNINYYSCLHRCKREADENFILLNVALKMYACCYGKQLSLEDVKLWSKNVVKLPTSFASPKELVSDLLIWLACRHHHQSSHMCHQNQQYTVHGSCYKVMQKRLRRARKAVFSVPRTTAFEKSITKSPKREARSRREEHLSFSVSLPSPLLPQKILISIFKDFFSFFFFSHFLYKVSSASQVFHRKLWSDHKSVNPSPSITI